MKKWLSIFLKLLFIIFIALCITYLFHNCTLKASAATQIELTLEETLAAYGREMTAQYYNKHTSKVSNIKLTYIGDTRAWCSEQQIEDDCNIGFHGVSPSSQILSDWQQLPPCLIYWYDDFSDNDIFIGNDPYNYHANISLEIPVEFENITGFRQNIFWSGYLGSDNRTSAYCSGTKCRMFGSFGTSDTIALYTGYQSHNQQYMYGVWSPYSLRKYYFDESKLAYMQRFNIIHTESVDYSTPFDIYKLKCNFDSCGTVDLSGLKIGGARYWTGKFGFYVLVGCPTLYSGNFSPIISPITTAPYETAVTGIGTTETGVNLNGISSDIAEIIRNQRWQIRQNDILIQNEGVINDNLIRILTRLNDIYTQMLASGDLSPDLVPSDSLVTLPTDLQAQIHTALRGTWPTMSINSFGEAPAVYAEFFNLFREPPFNILFSLGVFGLALSVAGWFLFKGRN